MSENELNRQITSIELEPRASRRSRYSRSIVLLRNGSQTSIIFPTFVLANDTRMDCSIEWIPFEERHSRNTRSSFEPWSGNNICIQTLGFLPDNSFYTWERNERERQMAPNWNFNLQNNFMIAACRNHGTCFVRETSLLEDRTRWVTCVISVSHRQRTDSIRPPLRKSNHSISSAGCQAAGEIWFRSKIALIETRLSRQEKTGAKMSLDYWWAWREIYYQFGLRIPSLSLWQVDDLIK